MASSEPTSAQRRLIDDILCLYQCNPKEQSYIHYTDDAVFHDPVSIAKGRKSIQSQFNGMPKIFAQSTTEHYSVLPESTPETLKLDLTQRYVFKKPFGDKMGTEKTVNSKLTFKLDSAGKIVEHLEEWDHQPNKTSDDGFTGWLQEKRKEVGAKLVETMVSSDPNKVNPNA